MAGYSGTPLAKKLMIKEGRRVVLIAAPEHFEGLVDPLPEGARISRAASGEGEVIVAFVKSRAELSKRWAASVKRLAESGALWIAWPKKAAKIATDLDENVVRDHGLADGLVDYKVCAIDETWSGLCFARRSTKAKAAKAKAAKAKAAKAKAAK